MNPLREAYRRARKTLFRRVQTHEAYQTVFGSPQGEEVLRHICRVGYVTTSTFVKGDPYQTSLNEGKRMLALSILKFVHKDHAKLIQQVEKELDNEMA